MNKEAVNTMYQRLLIFSDGGARGNPGPAAIAFLALNDKCESVKADSRFIGIRTNNQAEYEALIIALQFASSVKAEEVVCHLDSELVAKQLNREYAVKNFELHKLWRKVQELRGCFKKISFVNVPRSNPQIQRADALVNKTLDEESI
jgi:ribonuclease HI